MCESIIAKIFASEVFKEDSLLFSFSLNINLQFSEVLSTYFQVFVQLLHQHSSPVHDTSGRYNLYLLI